VQARGRKMDSDVPFGDEGNIIREGGQEVAVFSRPTSCVSLTRFGSLFFLTCFTLHNKAKPDLVVG
jgi:hypothetical protein